jgi:hypothetical protein
VRYNTYYCYNHADGKCKKEDCNIPHMTTAEAKKEAKGKKKDPKAPAVAKP